MSAAASQQHGTSGVIIINRSNDDEQAMAVAHPNRTNKRA
jgi:hypothetical protein